MMKIHNGGASNAWDLQMATMHIEPGPTKHWAYDRTATHQAKPKNVENPTDKGQDGTWATKTWQPVIRRTTINEKVESPYLAAGALLLDQKGACMEKVVNGSIEKTKITITLHELHVCCMGTCFYFRKLRGRGATAYDSRSPKVRRSLEFVRSELNRMCGETMGEDLFNQFLIGY